jgi:hypothetical protein
MLRLGGGEIGLTTTLVLSLSLRVEPIDGFGFLVAQLIALGKLCVPVGARASQLASPAGSVVAAAATRAGSRSRSRSSAAEASAHL